MQQQEYLVIVEKELKSAQLSSCASDLSKLAQPSRDSAGRLLLSHGEPVSIADDSICDDCWLQVKSAGQDAKIKKINLHY